MSQRGSFTTQYIYCDKCLNACKNVLTENNKYLKGVQIESWQDGNVLPIISGKIGGSWQGKELASFIFGLIPEIQIEMCCECELQIAVIPDDMDGEIIKFKKDTNLDNFYEE